MCKCHEEQLVNVTTTSNLCASGQNLECSILPCLGFLGFLVSVQNLTTEGIRNNYKLF